MADSYFSELETEMIEAESRLRKLRKREKAIQEAAGGARLPPSPSSPRLAELEKAIRAGRSKHGKLLRKLNRIEGE